MEQMLLVLVKVSGADALDLHQLLVILFLKGLSVLCRVLSLPIHVDLKSFARLGHIFSAVFLLSLDRIVQLGLIRFHSLLGALD